MCYFDNILRYPEATTAVIAHNLRHPKLGRVDCVVGIGLSGTMPLVSVKQATGLSVVALRKPGASSHGGESITVPFLGCCLPVRYVILDDFTTTGRTVRELIRRMKETHPKWECAGAIFYHDASNQRAVEGLPVRLDVDAEIISVVHLIDKWEELS